MSTSIGFERKIGYSFVGLMAGNVASLVALLLIALLPRLDAFAAIKHFWKLDVEGALGLSLATLVVSMLCWVVVGLSLVLLLSTEIAAGLHWVIAAFIGAVLGVSALLLFLVALFRPDVVDFWKPETLDFFLLAALIAAVAFAVYCALVRAVLRRQAKENGAPKGTPRSLAWFDF